MLNKKIFIIVCAILLSFLLALIIFGQRELSHMYKIKEELKTLEKQNAQLKSENLSLKIQIDIWRIWPVMNSGLQKKMN